MGERCERWLWWWRKHLATNVKHVSQNALREAVNQSWRFRNGSYPDQVKRI